MTDRLMVVNEGTAQDFVDSIQDQVVKNLVVMGVAEARMRLARRVGQTEKEWREALPSEPLDMHFFVRVLAAAFSERDVVQAVLDGKSLPEAAGWDV
jgi:hypothetical protein